MGPLFTHESIPAYHDDLLLISMNPSLPAPPAGMVADAVPAPGLAAVSFYERAGMIKRVTPIKAGRLRFESNNLIPPAGMVLDALQDSTTRPGERSATVLATSAHSDGGSRAINLLELERGANEQELRKALAQDPSIRAVSRVPIRYLTMPAAARSGGARTTRRTRNVAAPASDTPGGAVVAAAPPDVSLMWNLKMVRWFEAIALAGYREAKTIKVAVLDTGIDTDHPDLKPQIRSYSWDHPDIPKGTSAKDLIGHGTHVAGTIAATINNALGINGLCNCEIHAWKIFDDTPDLWDRGNGTAHFVYYVTPLLYLRALLDCLDSNMDVINLSIGGPAPLSSAEADAFSALIANNTTVVAAMGNDRWSGSPTSYPAATPGVIAVGATNVMDEITNFSNRGKHIAVTAPGDAIWSTLPTYAGQSRWGAIKGPDGNWQIGQPVPREINYDAWPGTSMAAPHISAAAAIYLANGGPRSPLAFREALTATVDKIAAMKGENFTPDYGYGRLNLEALIRRLQNSGAPGP